MLSFTQNTMHFDFDRRISVTLESSYIYRRKTDSKIIEAGTVPVAESKLMHLVGCKVESAYVVEPDRLILDIDNGNSIEFIDDSPQYESFQITIGDCEIIV